MAVCLLASPWPPSAAVGIDWPEHQPLSPYARSQASSAVPWQSFRVPPHPRHPASKNLGGLPGLSGMCGAAVVEGLHAQTMTKKVYTVMPSCLRERLIADAVIAIECSREAATGLA